MEYILSLRKEFSFGKTLRYLESSLMWAIVTVVYAGLLIILGNHYFGGRN
jgi:hypothetical protein